MEARGEDVAADVEEVPVVNDVPVVNADDPLVSEVAGLREEMARVLRRMGVMERRIRHLESGETGPGRYSVIPGLQESVTRGGWGHVERRRADWVTEWDDRGKNEMYEAGLLDGWIPELDVSYIGGDYPWWVVFATRMDLVVNKIQVDRNDVMEVMRQLLPDESFGAIQYRNWEVRGYGREGGVGRVTSTVVFLEDIELTDSDELWSSENLELVVTSFVAGLSQPQVGGWHRLDLPLYHADFGGVSDIGCVVHLWCRLGRSERLEEIFERLPCKSRRDMRDVMVPTTVGSFTAAPDRRPWPAEAVGEVRWLPGSAMAVEAAGLYPLMGRGVDPSAWVREVRTLLKYGHRQEKTYYCVRRLNRDEIMGVLDVPDVGWDMLNERDWRLILRSLLKTPIGCRQPVAEMISEFLEEIRQERARIMVEDGEAMEEVMEEVQEENDDGGTGVDPNAVIYSAGEETDNEDEDDW
jgi:hypothetical protein